MIVLALVLMGIILLRPKPNADSVLSQQMMDDQMVSITVGGVETNEDRKIFLSERGWEVSDNEIETKQVQIPSEFDEVYTKYNEMQVAQGFDLSKFKGKTVDMYTYQIFNYPDTQEEIFANILIYKNKIIGGDISSSRLDGQMTGFDKT